MKLITQYLMICREISNNNNEVRVKKCDWFHLHKQQTPKPEAHDPEAVPPNLEQSEEL